MIDPDAWGQMLANDPRAVDVSGDFEGKGLFYSESFFDENRQRSKTFLETRTAAEGVVVINDIEYTAQSFEKITGDLFKTTLQKNA